MGNAKSKQGPGNWKKGPFVGELAHGLTLDGVSGARGAEPGCSLYTRPNPLLSESWCPLGAAKSDRPHLAEQSFEIEGAGRLHKSKGTHS